MPDFEGSPEPTWRQKIDAAEKRGKFTEEDMGDVCCWTFCFVGEYLHHKNVHALFRSHQIDEATYERLCKLGGKAATAVVNNKIQEANRMYESIHKIPLKEAKA